jgi:hypothetical protein
MDHAADAQLREIGLQLDAGTYPRVFNDGIVALSNPDVGVFDLSAENDYEFQGKSRPSAGSWQGATRRQGAAARSRSSGEAGPSGGGLLRENYLGQLDAVFDAYPRTAYWLCREGMWLSVESAVLANLDRRVTFLIAIPFRPMRPVRAWAFWTRVIGFEWVGPRHTNAVDGSICAFNPSEGTWQIGGSLVELIDHYTIWAFLQLHLERLHWWPGKQTAQFIHERLTELNDNEWCGCSPDAKRYADCCKQSDLASDRFQAAVEFVGGFLRFKPRQPPVKVTRFLWERRDPPEFQTAGVDPILLFGSCLMPVRGQRLPTQLAGLLVPPLRSVQRVAG